MSVSSSSGVSKAQNIELGKLIRPAYTFAELDCVRKALIANGIIKIRRYKSGGHSAVSVLDLEHTLENAVDGLLVFHWDRDNIMQCLAELALAENPQLNDGLNLPGDQWKRGLLASIIHHHKGEHRFLDIIRNRRSGYPSDYFHRPHIRYNPISLHEVGDPWGHGQNDSLSFINFLLFYALNTGRMKLEDGQHQSQLADFATLLHAYFWKINVWADFDLGAWEDRVAEHWSSIACALISLRVQYDFMVKHGPMSTTRDGETYYHEAKGVLEMAQKCEERLRELGTREFIRADGGGERQVDLAQINPILLAAFCGRPILDDENTVAILENIERVLMADIGIARYEHDTWDGRINRQFPRGSEAQWCHGSPQMSYIYGELFQRTGENRFYDKQVMHFNRALASVSPRWMIPEAWIIDAKTGEWVADANEPLAWAQSMLALSVVQMHHSIKKREAAEPSFGPSFIYL